MDKDPVKKILEKIEKEEKEDESEMQLPATDEQIKKLKKEVLEKLNFEISDDYIKFLKFHNGLCFNGLTIYGTDISRGEGNRLLNHGFIQENLGCRIDWKNSRKENLIIFGRGNESCLVYDSDKKKYQHRDEMARDVFKSYNTFEKLFIGVVKDEAII